MLLSILIEVKRARGAKGHYIPKLLELLDDKLRRSGCQITWIWPKCSVFLATVKRYIHTGGVSKALSLVPEEWLFKQLLLLTFPCFYLQCKFAFPIIKQNSKIKLNQQFNKSKRVVLPLYTFYALKYFKSSKNVDLPKPNDFIQ